MKKSDPPKRPLWPSSDTPKGQSTSKTDNATKAAVGHPPPVRLIFVQFAGPALSAATAPVEVFV